MISSIPQRFVPATERALYQTMCDLGDIAAAGWEMRLVPTDDPYALNVVFRSTTGVPTRNPIRGYPALCTSFSYPALRFALPSELLRIIPDFHRRVVPAAPVDDLSATSS